MLLTSYLGISYKRNIIFEWLHLSSESSAKEISGNYGTNLGICMRDYTYNSMQYLVFVANISTHDCAFSTLNYVVCRLLLSLGIESYVTLLYLDIKCLWLLYLKLCTHRFMPCQDLKLKFQAYNCDVYVIDWKKYENNIWAIISRYTWWSLMYKRPKPEVRKFHNVVKVD